MTPIPQIIANKDSAVRPLIEWYPADPPNATRDAILVFAGGGYCCRCDDREGVAVAKRFNKDGISAAVVYYRQSETGDHFPTPLEDAKAAVRWARENASELDINPDRIGVCGFSAGGNLAGLVATCTEKEWSEQAVSSRPDFAVLCYPVVLMGHPQGHSDSCKNLLGPENFGKEEMRKLVSLEQRVSEATPPMFLMHTAQDRLVPAQNSLLLALALQNADIPVELHVFRIGSHGRDLGNGADDSYPIWPELVRAWLAKLD